MEKKPITSLFNSGSAINQRLFEKKIIAPKRLTKKKEISGWFNTNNDKLYDVIITGGIGDFIAIEGFLFKKYYNKIGNVILATRGYKEITILLNNAYPKLNVINLFPQFPNNFYAFIVGEDVLNYLYDNDCISRGVIEFDRSNNLIIDFSIYKIFEKIKNNHLEFDNSVFMDNKFADIDKFGLPKKYAAIVTTSNRDPIHKARGRNLTEFEINRVVEYLNNENIKGVCVYCNCNKPNKNLIHLKSITPIESLEVIKNSVQYIGIDSWLSVIAGYKFDHQNIKIKCFNPHGLNNRECYYPQVKTKTLFESDFNTCLF